MYKINDKVLIISCINTDSRFGIEPPMKEMIGNVYTIKNNYKNDITKYVINGYLWDIQDLCLFSDTEKIYEVKSYDIKNLDI